MRQAEEKEKADREKALQAEEKEKADREKARQAEEEEKTDREKAHQAEEKENADKESANEEAMLQNLPEGDRVGRIMDAALQLHDIGLSPNVITTMVKSMFQIPADAKQHAQTSTSDAVTDIEQPTAGKTSATDGTAGDSVMQTEGEANQDLSSTESLVTDDEAEKAETGDVASETTKKKKAKKRSRKSRGDDDEKYVMEEESDAEEEEKKVASSKQPDKSSTKGSIVNRALRRHAIMVPQSEMSELATKLINQRVVPPRVGVFKTIMGEYQRQGKKFDCIMSDVPWNTMGGSGLMNKESIREDDQMNEDDAKQFVSMGKQLLKPECGLMVIITHFQEIGKWMKAFSKSDMVLARDCVMPVLPDEAVYVGLSGLPKDPSKAKSKSKREMVQHSRAFCVLFAGMNEASLKAMSRNNSWRSEFCPQNHYLASTFAFAKYQPVHFLSKLYRPGGSAYRLQEKSVYFLAWLLDRCTQPGWEILDPCAGTMSLALAALHRKVSVTVHSADCDDGPLGSGYERCKFVTESMVRRGMVSEHTLEIKTSSPFAVLNTYRRSQIIDDPLQALRDLQDNKQEEWVPEIFKGAEKSTEVPVFIEVNADEEVLFTLVAHAQIHIFTFVYIYQDTGSGSHDHPQQHETEQAMQLNDVDIVNVEESSPEKV